MVGVIALVKSHEAKARREKRLSTPTSQSSATILFMMAAVTILPYELYSDAPGVLFNKPEWDDANAAHPSPFDFGPLPSGWPSELQGPQVWTGEHLRNNRMVHQVPIPAKVH